MDDMKRVVRAGVEPIPHVLRLSDEARIAFALLATDKMMEANRRVALDVSSSERRDAATAVERWSLIARALCECAYVEVVADQVDPRQHDGS